MRRWVLIAHDDPKVLQAVATGLRNAGQDAIACGGSMAAIDALDSLAIDLLITRIGFAVPPNGIALARMALYRRPGLPVLFVANPKMRDEASDLGVLLDHSASVEEVVDAALKLLA